MWVCGFCETENQDDIVRCVCCGHDKMISEPPHKDSDSNSNRDGIIKPQEPVKRRPVLLIIASIMAVVAICFFTIHKWTPATCTEPERCSICGKVRSPATGHRWTTATCTEPQICSVCGVKGNAALGHIWTEATYETPKTCTRCGQQVGQVKGYVGDIWGTWSEANIYIRGNQWTHAYELSASIDNCFRISLVMTVTDYSGYPFGSWYLYARDLNGKWSHIGEFNIEKETIYETHRYDFDLESPVTFDALTVVQRGSNQYSIGYTINFTDVQQYVD